MTLYTSQNPPSSPTRSRRSRTKYGITSRSTARSTPCSRSRSPRRSGQQVERRRSGDREQAARVRHRRLKNGWVVDAVGPDLYKKAYDRNVFAKPGKAYIVGEAFLGIGWNTGQYAAEAQRLTRTCSTRRLRRQDRRRHPVRAVARRLVPLGTGELRQELSCAKLAAQKPKIYTSSLPMTQAAAVGRDRGRLVRPANAIDLQGAGRADQLQVPGERRRGTRHGTAMVLKQVAAPERRTAAAQLPRHEGGSAAVPASPSAPCVKNVPDTFYVQPRMQELADAHADEDRRRSRRTGTTLFR